MNLIDRIGHAFIMTFGITQPAPERRRTAHTVITVVLLAIAVGFVALVLFGASQLH